MKHATGTDMKEFVKALKAHLIEECGWSTVGWGGEEVLGAIDTFAEAWPSSEHNQANYPESMIPVWLPIATVPVDRGVDLWAGGERYTDCIFSESQWWCLPAGDWHQVENPTHWMRVPEGPKFTELASAPNAAADSPDPK